MWSSSQRAQSVFGTFTTVLFALCFAIACTSYLPFTHFSHTPSTKEIALSVPAITVKYSRAPRSYSSKQQEYAHVKFDLEADFTRLFHWNTKQVFAYVVARYGGDKYGSNEVTLWDRIIQRKEDARVSNTARKNKYAFGDITRKFDGRNATFALHWNVMPHVGVLQWGEVSGGQSLVFPERSN
jgi:signal peptidase complex subunit 3